MEKLFHAHLAARQPVRPSEDYHVQRKELFSMTSFFISLWKILEQALALVKGVKGRVEQHCSLHYLGQPILICFFLLEKGC